MENGNAPPAGEAGFGDVVVVGRRGLVESIEVQGRLPSLTEDEQIEVIVQ